MKKTNTNQTDQTVKQRIKHCLSLTVYPSEAQENTLLHVFRRATQLYNDDIVYRTNLVMQGGPQPSRAERYTDLVKGHKFPDVYAQVLSHILYKTSAHFYKIKKVKNGEDIQLPEVIDMIDSIGYFCKTLKIRRINGNWYLNIPHCGELLVEQPLIPISGRLSGVQLMYSPEATNKWIADVTLIEEK